jgi:hypothetical protein
VDRSGNVIAKLAAEASGRKLDQAILARFYEVMVEPDLAKLIDDHGRVREFGLAQQTAEQGGLAAAQKAGEHQGFDHERTGGRGATRARIGA